MRTRQHWGMIDRQLDNPLRDVGRRGRHWAAARVADLRGRRVEDVLVLARGLRPRSPRAAALLAVAAGAAALGTIAIGSIAVGAVAIGRLRLKEAHIERLVVGELTVERMHGPRAPDTPD
jgi:hypothetical protein